MRNNRRHFNLFRKLTRFMLTGKTKVIASMPEHNKPIDFSVFNFRRNMGHKINHLIVK